jgi:modulator of FtsH protease
MLLTVPLVAVALLAPGQPRQATGIEIAAISAILAFQAILIARHAYEHMRDRLSWVLWAMLLLLLPALALMIGGISFAIEAGGGLFWVLGGVLAGFAGASVNAWVLLVEIER